MQLRLRITSKQTIKYQHCVFNPAEKMQDLTLFLSVDIIMHRPTSFWLVAAPLHSVYINISYLLTLCQKIRQLHIPSEQQLPYFYF